MLRKCQGSVKEVSSKCQGSVNEVSRKCQGAVEKFLEGICKILRSYNNFSKNLTELLSEWGNLWFLERLSPLKTRPWYFKTDWVWAIWGQEIYNFKNSWKLWIENTKNITRPFLKVLEIFFLDGTWLCGFNFCF